MKSPYWVRRLVPSGLGAAMLAVIVIAALTPNIGIGAAQVQSQYTSGNNTGPTTLEYALIGVLVAAIIAALVGLLVFRRRKGGQGGVAAWEQPQGGSPDSGPSMDYTGGGGMAPAGAAVGGMGAAAAAQSYDETAPPPAEVGPEWAEPAAAATVGSDSVAPMAPPMDESEPDIDKLMKELDQISDDILKKNPPKKGAPPEAPPDDTET